MTRTLCYPFPRMLGFRGEMSDLMQETVVKVESVGPSEPGSLNAASPAPPVVFRFEKTFFCISERTAGELGPALRPCCLFIRAKE